MAENFPLSATRFRLEVVGSNISVAFTEVSGLTVETEILEHRTGVSWDTEKGAGNPKYGNVTCKRPVMNTTDMIAFYEWAVLPPSDPDKLRDVTISLLDDSHDPVLTWSLTGVFPVKVEGPALKSTGTDLAVESVELAVTSASVKAG